MPAPPRGGPGQRGDSAEPPRPTQANDTKAPGSGWVLVEKRRGPLPQLRPEDWSVPVVTADDVRKPETTQGVALVTWADAIELAKKGTRKGRLAVVVLGARRREAGGVETAVATRRGLRTEVRPAVLLQLGDELVGTLLRKTCAPLPPADEHRVSVVVARRYTTAEAWTGCGADARAWLTGHFVGEGVPREDIVSLTGIETRGTPGPTAQIRALLRVAGRSKEGALAASGKQGVFTTLKGDGRGALWLRDDLALDEAREAAARAKTSLIVSVRGMGVLKGEGEQAEAAMRALLGTAAAQEEEQPGQPGLVWDVDGFPRTISPVQAAAFLHAAGWTGVEVIRVIPKRGKRLAVVRGPEPPAWIFQVEATGDLVTVSTAREKDETQPKWVQAKTTEERTDPAEDGTERQGMTYAKAAFIGLYGRKQGSKAWSDGRPRTTGVAATHQQPAPLEAGRQSGPPVPGAEAVAAASGASIPQASHAPPPNAGKGGKKGKKGGKAGKPQPVEQDVQRPDEARAKLEKEVLELRAQNAGMCRRMEELGTLVEALRAQLQAQAGAPQKTTSPSPKRQAPEEPGKVKKRPRSQTKSKSRSPEPPKQPPSKTTRTLKQMGFGSTAPARK
ncbi:hypothetical protein DIPPA_25011 [Diplonema papillatum]|nr:hypothetical protein DIPPA_25011 [Diplonema papillatum]